MNKPKRHRRTKKEMEEARAKEKLLVTPPPQPPPPPKPTVHYAPPPKRRRRRTKAEMEAARVAEVKELKQKVKEKVKEVAKPVEVVENKWIESIQAIAHIDRGKLQESTIPEVKSFALHCSGQHWNTLPYNKETIARLQRVLDVAFANTHVKAKVLTMRITIGDFLVKELFCKDGGDSFYVSISYDKRELKFIANANPKINETKLLNEINALLPKGIKGGIGICK